MDSMKDLLILISNNYMTIIVIAVLGLGIYAKIKAFLSKSRDEQKAILKESMTGEASILMDLIRNGMLDLVVDAEKKFGEKTGQLKSSAVYNMIVEKYPDVVNYIKQGYITQDFIDDCIDDGVDLMNDLIYSNKYLKAVVNNTVSEPTVSDNDVKYEDNTQSVTTESLYSSYEDTDSDDYSYDGSDE